MTDFTPLHKPAQAVVVDLAKRRGPARERLLADLRASVAAVSHNGRLSMSQEEQSAYFIDQDKAMIAAGMRRLSTRIGTGLMLAYIKELVEQAEGEGEA